MEDEVGYLFYPKQYDYCFENYFSEFSSKSRKKIRRELDKFETAGVSYRYDHPADMERMFQMNREAYGELSYFSDPAFYLGFRKLLLWLETKNMLRLTTVLINGEVAAIDVGAVYHSTYTVLAGGVNREFPGIAKLINFHHLKWACQKQFKTVDFLCGDYGWKERFHLTPRPLYKMERPAVPAVIRRPGFARYATA
jgi:CelD/BcsL family acetyltransferase involved in cellulose biosynthesis